MKMIIVFIGLVFITPSAMADSQVISVDIYHFTDNLDGLVSALKQKLADEAESVCSTSLPITIENPVFIFKRGELAGNGPLEGSLIRRGDDDVELDFPSHPFVSLSAEVFCNKLNLP